MLMIRKDFRKILHVSESNDKLEMKDTDIMMVKMSDRFNKTYYRDVLFST